MRWAAVLSLFLLLPQGGWGKDYLYFRDVRVPPFQTLREFFDLPDRPGRYEITLVSDAAGPLTFRILRVEGEKERLVSRKRSYRLGDHQFQARFPNPQGRFDLIVEVANSNPALGAKVSVYVVELP